MLRVAEIEIGSSEMLAHGIISQNTVIFILTMLRTFKSHSYDFLGVVTMCKRSIFHTIVLFLENHKSILLFSKWVLKNVY
jgi:hypothetical protein